MVAGGGTFGCKPVVRTTICGWRRATAGLRQPQISGDRHDPAELGYGAAVKPIDLVVVFDAADIETESAFWASLLEADVDKADDWHSIRTSDGRRLAVQLAPDHTPPEWPDGSPQQMHVDLWVEDVESAEQEVLARGARLLKAVDDEQFRVYADPAGHPFCLCWH